MGLTISLELWPFDINEQIKFSHISNFYRSIAKTPTSRELIDSSQRIEISPYRGISRCCYQRSSKLNGKFRRKLRGTDGHTIKSSIFETSPYPFFTIWWYKMFLFRRTAKIIFTKFFSQKVFDIFCHVLKFIGGTFAIFQTRRKFQVSLR